MNDEMTEELVKRLGLKTTAGREALRVAVENVQLLDAKQQDYGPHNISAFGLFGCVVRMNDKVERFKNLQGFDREQKAALKKFNEVNALLSKNWHKFSMIEVANNLDDAMTQFKVLFAKKRKPAINEKLRDTFRDISNYATIALLLDAGKWPLREEEKP